VIIKTTVCDICKSPIGDQSREIMAVLDSDCVPYDRPQKETRSIDLCDRCTIGAIRDFAKEQTFGKQLAAYVDRKSGRTTKVTGPI
jgi:hypothetical protein